MFECKICGKNLYQNITFSNMFKLNYEIHKDCMENLQFNIENEVIPIESNTIIYDYVFEKLNEGYNEGYLWINYFGINLEKHLTIGEWSIMIIYDKSIEYFMKNNNPYLLINLSNNPILLLSLNRKNTSYLEGL